MSKVLSNSIRCVVSSCESMTIARSWICLARADTPSAGADCVRTSAGRARTAQASAAHVNVYLMRAILLQRMNGCDGGTLRILVRNHENTKNTKNTKKM